MTSKLDNLKNNRQRVTIFMHPALAKHARAQAVVEDLTLTILIAKALIKYLPKETIIKKAEIKIFSEK